MVQHVLLFLRNKKSIILLSTTHYSTITLFTLSLGLFLSMLTFLCEIIKTLDEFFGQEGFILLETILLRAKSCGLYILYFEFDRF